MSDKKVFIKEVKEENRVKTVGVYNEGSEWKVVYAEIDPVSGKTIEYKLLHAGANKAEAIHTLKVAVFKLSIEL